METRGRVWSTNGGNRENDSNNPDVVSFRTSATSSVLRSADKSLPLHQNLIGVQSRFRRKYYHKVVLAALILLIIILVITVIILAYKGHSISKNQVCSSRQCLRVSADLVYSMDTATDPCDDFYQFTCGNWAISHPKPDSVTSNDWFREAQTKILRNVRDFLKSEINETQPKAVAKIKQMYEACMDIELMDKLNLSPLMYYLKLFELPSVPLALNITLPDNTMSDENVEFNWVRSLVQIKRHMGLDLLIGFDIYPDPLNRSVNKIALGSPEIDTVLPFNDDYHLRLLKAKRKLLSQFTGEDSLDDDQLSAYVGYLRKIITCIVVYLYPEINSLEVSKAAMDLALDAVQISMEIYEIYEEAENLTKASINPLDDLVYLTVSELQNETDKLIYPKTYPIWESYIDLIMEPNKQFQMSEEVLLTSHADIVYLQSITELLVNISTPRLQFFIWMSIVEELVLHTTSDIRNLHSEYVQIVVKTEGGTPRSLYCAYGINNMMGLAVSYSLARDEFIVNTLPRVHDMLFNIQEAFNDLVRSTSWMDDKTKRATLEKSAGMKSLIGFPQWITNNTAIDAYYAEVNVSSKTHLDNMINVLTWEMGGKINTFKDENKFGWATSPSNVNAFHTFQSNTITIPIAILQYPFYEMGLEALNYGAIGTILGHELTHGFDDSGRMFDGSGNMRQWWSDKTVSEYIDRTQCFIEQYSHYKLSDIDEYVDGKLTLGENIADNGGLREAFYAYKKYVKKYGGENKLPGLEKYSHEQLFFISFGNLWCETLTPAASHSALEDSHCPGSIRLKGVLSNSEEFASAFQCKRGSGMFPNDNRCRIW